jgi:hypothetical protein
VCPLDQPCADASDDGAGAEQRDENSERCHSGLTQLKLNGRRIDVRCWIVGVGEVQ